MVKACALYVNKIVTIAAYASVDPAGGQPFGKVDKQVLIVIITGQRPVMITKLGSRGFISWPGVSI